LLRVKLRHLDGWNADRREAAARYDKHLSALPGVIPPHRSAASKAVYHLYVIRSRERDAMAEHLKTGGVHTALHYPVPAHLQNCYRAWGYTKGSLPVSEQMAAEVLSLPMFPSITPVQQNRVAELIEAFAAVGAGR
jgi:dTDP-4-amino-4,6-dideoxygalactose transaminase